MTRSTPKPTTTESSSMSSLGELMRIEKERQTEEENARLREHEAKLRADEDAAKRLVAAEDEARRKVAEESRAHAEEAARVAARAEAEGRAVVEREKVLAQEAARETQRQKERDHELAVRRLELQAAAERSPLASLAGYGLAAVVLVVAVLVQLLVVGPAHAREVAAAADATKQQGHTIDTLRAERDGQKARADGSTKELDQARTRLAALEAELAQIKVASRGGKAGAFVPAPPPSPRATKPGEPCQKGDPLCPTIGNGP